MVHSFGILSGEGGERGRMDGLIQGLRWDFDQTIRHDDFKWREAKTR